MIDLDGNLTGLITTSALAHLRPALRHHTRLGDIATPLGRFPATERETAIRGPSTPPAGVLGTTIVLDGGRPCGVLTDGDLNRALAVAALGEAPDHSPGAFDDLRPGL